jgi:hypothetical protein
MPLINPQKKKSMGVKPGLGESQLIHPTSSQSIDKEIVHPEQCIQWHKNGLVHHLVGK